MSLVNDLLIESERRRTRRPQGDAPRLDDLVPLRDDAARPPARGITGFARTLAPGLGALLALSLAAGLGAGVAALHDEPSAAALPPLPEVAARPAPGPGPEQAAAPREARAVAAPPTSSSATAGPARIAVSAERPARVEAVLVDRLAGATRLRVETDGPTRHRVAHDPASRRLELVLENASLSAPPEPFELVDTPIRSLDLDEDAGELRLALVLDHDVESRTRWLERERGAVLVLDLSRGSEPPLTAASGLPVPAAAPPPARIDSPGLGDPAALRIERSDRDRERAARAARREALTEALASARKARAEGRLEEAGDRYAEIALVAPDAHAALCEWSEVLERLGRTDDALALLESARAGAPREPTLLVAQAGLLERRGERDAAIALLDQSGLAVTEAPEAHALAAAFLQRAGRHEAAIERYELVLRRFPEESRGWLGLGISLEAVGRSEQARDVYRIALQVGELPASTRHWVSSRLASLGEEER